MLKALIDLDIENNSVQSLTTKEIDKTMKYVEYRPTDNRYQARKMINGIKIQVYGRTQRECYNKFVEKMKQIKIQNDVFLKEKNTLEIWWQTWYKEEKEPYIKDRTKQDLLMVYKKINPLLKMKLENITAETIKLFFNKVEENRSKEKVFLYLKACFNSAIKHKKIKSNPFDIIITPKRKIKHKNAFTYEEQKTILENLKNTALEPIILIYLATGMRKLEFDFKNIEKHIDFQEKVLKAENLKGRGTEKRYKNIKITQKVIDIIMNNLETIHKANEVIVYKRFNSFLKKINIKGSLVNCRHTYATNNFYLGNPELFISRQMGHSKSQITKDIYTDIDNHLSKEKVEELYPEIYYKFWLKFWLKFFYKIYTFWRFFLNLQKK